MLKKMKTLLLASSAFLLTLIASTSASTASIWLSYEPDIPESLKRDL